MTARATIKIRPDGSTEPRLTVVGFHGTVEPSSTPGRTGPVFGYDGRIARIVRVRGDSVEIDVSRTPVSALPPTATPLSEMPARVGNIVIVLGDAERREIWRLRDAACPDIADLLSAWERGDTQRLAEHCAQQVDHLLAWYCRPADALALLDAVKNTALADLALAMSRGDDGARYQSGWWLARAAVDNNDIYLATAAIEARDQEIARSLLEALAGEPSVDDRARGMSEARQRLHELPPPATVASRIDPVLLAARRGVRSHSIVPRAA